MRDIAPGADEPVISVRANGDRLVGDAGPLAQELYEAGTPPMHGFAAKRPIAARISAIRMGDELRVERQRDEWVALDDQGVIGHLRWQAAQDGKPDVLGVIIRYPKRGVLRVRRLLLDAHGGVKDVGGYVTPID